MPPKAKKTTKKRTSGNPAVRAHEQAQHEADDKYAPSTWLSAGQGQLTDLTCPSGQLCLAKQPGVEGLMKAGVLHNVDSLTGIVNAKFINEGKTGAESVNLPALAQDEEALAEILHTVDRVVTHVVVKPRIEMTPGDVTRRKDGVIYADMVDILDKMFIFNFAVGGSRDVEPFRRGLEELVGSLETEPVVPQAAK